MSSQSEVGSPDKEAKDPPRKDTVSFLAIFLANVFGRIARLRVVLLLRTGQQSGLGGRFRRCPTAVSRIG